MIDNLANKVKEISNNGKRLSTKISEIERDIEEHRRPAEELNSDLHAYLGVKDISFEVRGDGYQIVRNCVAAKNLSEGEKTAIAFLYFLKSLSDKEFDLKNGVVVIDDPISSLDSNSIYHACGFMQDRTNWCLVESENYYFGQIQDIRKLTLHRLLVKLMLRCDNHIMKCYA